MKKIKKILWLLFLLIIFLNSISFAQAEMRVISSMEQLKKDEEISIKIEIDDANVAAFSLEIFYDEEKLEYVKGPEKSNYSNNRVLYMWLSDSGKNKQNIETEEFIFKGIQDGIASIIVLGDFYDENGQSIEIDNSNLQIKIGKKEDQIKQKEEIQEQNNDNIEANNVDLSILRLDQEGISPDFNKDIKEYYFIADSTINDLNITAIPKNKNATVTVTGNKNLKMGKNVIEINIESEDKTKKEVYKIFVTKTTNITLANANLENLAISQSYLTPYFEPDMTKYKVEIPNQINKIDILAIPQNEKAQVSIEGNNEMKIGDNIVLINVLAEDKITSKKYEIIVRRRNEQEQQKYEEERQIEVEKLSAILEEEKRETRNINAQMQNEKANRIMPVIIIVLGTVIIIGAIYILKKKKKI